MLRTNIIDIRLLNLKSRMEAFVDVRMLGLWASSKAATCTNEISECQDVMHFLLAAEELLLSGKSERKVLVHLGCDVYEPGLCDLNGWIKIHLGAGIVVEMTYAEAKKYLTRRIRDLTDEIDELHKTMADCAALCSN